MGLDSGLDSGLDLTSGYEIIFPILSFPAIHSHPLFTHFTRYFDRSDIPISSEKHDFHPKFFVLHVPIMGLDSGLDSGLDLTQGSEIIFPTFYPLFQQVRHQNQSLV